MIYTPQEYDKMAGRTLLNDMNKNMNDKFAFLTSSRFWAMVIGAVSMYLKAKGIIGEPEMLLIATITGGFIVVKTVDRNTGDAVMGAAEVGGKKTTVTMPPDSEVTASTKEKVDANY